jgi:hypothetical protein
MEAQNSIIAKSAWDPHFTERSPMFEPLRPVATQLKVPHWPSPADLQRLVATRPSPFVTEGGAPLRFVAQGARPRRLEDRYEARIYRTGEVQLRPANWHDLLNALVWLTFPRAKSALNARHHEALLTRQASGAGNRGPLQDTLTLFDEGGVIIAASDPDLLRLVETFAWKELFWSARARVRCSMCFVLFGHALYEKALAPFTGITGRGILLEVAPDFFDGALPGQIESLDLAVAEHLRDPARLHTTRELAPVPVLGVPGWCGRNECADYYDDTVYFRPGRGA